MQREERQRIERLRELFLKESQGTRSQQSYWRDDEDLSLYDRVLAERIRWKWLGILRRIESQGQRWSKPVIIWDWGCGTGAAGETLVRHLGVERVRSVFLQDRDPKAEAFAQRKLQAMGVQANRGAPPANTDSLLLLASHVANELDEDGVQALTRAASRAEMVLMVEPGSMESSRAMIKIWSQWRDELKVLSPCPGSERCPLLSAPDGRDWCHFFVKPPSHVHQDPEWSTWAREFKLDLRSLPVSFALLVRGEVGSGWKVPDGVLVGRPRLLKYGAQVWWCDRDGQFQQREIRRRDPEFLQVKHHLW